MTTPRRMDLAPLFAGLPVSVPDIQVSGLALDSRRVMPGDLFLAVHGSAAHGLSHLQQALDRGAAAVAWEPAPGIDAPQAGVPAFAVPHLGREVGGIASRFYADPSSEAFVFGVTGTDGKTSTSHLLAQAFEHLGRSCAYLGTLGMGPIGALEPATHTTPDPVSLQAWLRQSVNAGHTAIAMEVSSHALDQNRVGGVAFDAVALTNLQRDHLDYHGTLAHYAASKRRLFDADDGRALILNRDDAFGLQCLRDLASRAASRLVVYGLDGEAASTPRYVIGRNLQLDQQGLSLTLDTHRGSARVQTRLLGRFNAYNLMAAAAALLVADLSLDEVVAALSAVRTVPGRIEAFRGDGFAPLVVVDYAHTPQALEQILKAVREHTPGRLWCVFGCGGDRDRGKRPLMAAAAAAQADDLVITDDNPRSESPQSIVADMLAGLPAEASYRVIHERTLAICFALQQAGPEDAVVVAGKGHEDYQIVGSERYPYSDRAEVSRLLGCEIPR